MLQVPVVALKMSTTLEEPTPSTAQGMRQARVVNTNTLNPLAHPPHTHAHPATPQTKVTRRTIAASEERDSGIRQRRGCKGIPSLAEDCSAPSSSRRVEDVHNFGGDKAIHCTRHETGSRRKHNRTQPTRASPSRPYPSCNTSNKSHKTYLRHQRRSRLRHSAATWLQDTIEPG